jgi:hypothetical protein
MSDPTLPPNLIAALEDLGVSERASGTLILGLGAPVFLSQVRRAIEHRYGVTDPQSLDLACEAVNRVVREARRPSRLPVGESWVTSWMAPRPRIF